MISTLFARNFARERGPSRGVSLKDPSQTRGSGVEVTNGLTTCFLLPGSGRGNEEAWPGRAAAPEGEAEAVQGGL